MELPDDVLKIIKEYSQPLTRGDWRKGSYTFRNGIYDDEIIKKIIDEIVMDIPVEYVNYLRNNEYGYMILNYEPTLKEIENIFNNTYYKVINFIYEKYGNIYILRSDYIELERI